MCLYLYLNSFSNFVTSIFVFIFVLKFFLDPYPYLLWNLHCYELQLEPIIFTSEKNLERQIASIVPDKEARKWLFKFWKNGQKKPKGKRIILYRILSRWKLKRPIDCSSITKSWKWGTPLSGCNAKDIEVVNDGNLWKLMQKAASSFEKC